MLQLFQSNSFPTLFFVFVGIIFLILFFTVFKKPEKVKLVGSFGLVFCIAYAIYGLVPALSALEASGGDVSKVLVYGALKIMAFQIFCGLVLYLISLFLRIALKRADF